MKKKIIIYKNLEDYNSSYASYCNEFGKIGMIILDRIEKVYDFNFKDFDLVISHNFSREEKEILSRKILKDSRIEKTTTRLLHKEK